MDKCEKLWRSVQESGVPVLKLTFAEIEEILGFPLIMLSFLIRKTVWLTAMK